MNTEIIGKEVLHNTFCNGTIINIENDKITVRFEDGDRRFEYPDAFLNKFLVFCDENLDIEVQMKISKIERENIEKNNQHDELVEKYSIVVGESRIEDKRVDEVLNERNIKYLVHFTSLDNLPSILKRGFLTRKELDNRGIKYIYNDEFRLEGHADALCFSIEFPNYKMFYKYRKMYPNQDWVVIGVSAQALIKHNCLFYKGNAASEPVSCVKEHLGGNAFQKMFSEQYGRVLRRQLNIPNSYSTNPQAEVLVLGCVPLDEIIFIDFLSPSSVQQYRSLIPQNVRIEEDKGLFDRRIDSIFW